MTAPIHLSTELKDSQPRRIPPAVGSTRLRAQTLPERCGCSAASTVLTATAAPEMIRRISGVIALRRASGPGSVDQARQILPVCTERWGRPQPASCREGARAQLFGPTAQAISGSSADRATIPAVRSAILTTYGSTTPRLENGLGSGAHSPHT